VILPKPDPHWRLPIVDTFSPSTGCWHDRWFFVAFSFVPAAVLKPALLKGNKKPPGTARAKRHSVVFIIKL
jgi:hypothetical protein